MVSRVTVYPQEEILDTHILRTNKFAMTGLGFLMQAVLGTGTLVDGLACTPTAPASLAVNVASGSIYSLQVADATAYGTEPADSTPLVKQGIAYGSTPFTLTPPATAGNSQVYLVQAIYQDQDTASASIPFVNSSDGSQTYQTVNTERRGVCVLGLKAGIIANTGSQATPAADAGWTGLYAITVASGQTTIASPNIVTLGTAPFVPNKLTSLSPLNSPAFTGSPTAPTPAPGDNSTLLATTAFARITASAYTPTIFTANGTFTTPATSGPATVYRYRLISGGGGGGGANASGAAGGGGGAGAEAIGTFTGVAANTAITITIGGGGAAGSAGGTNGGNGGNSTLGAPIGVTCAGGGFGTGSTTANTGAFGGNGGAVTTGNPMVAILGQRGTNGLGVSPSVMLGGNGGSTSLGSAGVGGCVNVVGNAGLSTGYGSGGGGGISTGNGGSAGQAGFCLIEQLTP